MQGAQAGNTVATSSRQISTRQATKVVLHRAAHSANRECEDGMIGSNLQPAGAGPAHPGDGGGDQPNAEQIGHQFGHISNYATINIKDVLTRVDGVGDTVIVGARDYSMRVWLNPALVQSRGLTPSDVVTALRAANVQVAAGAINQPPATSPGGFQVAVQTPGRLTSPDQFSDIIVATDQDGPGDAGARHRARRTRFPTRLEAAVQAAGTRLRPILMTSFAFILGVIPLVLATGAGAELRQALGTAVFFGMLGLTVFGLLVHPGILCFRAMDR
jgi:multidrug efflux pump subunit AcrB